jgi:hypothetical protein
LKLVLDANVYCDFAEGLPDAVDVHFESVDQIEAMVLR